MTSVSATIAGNRAAPLATVAKIFALSLAALLWQGVAVFGAEADEEKSSVADINTEEIEAKTPFSPDPAFDTELEKDGDLPPFVARPPKAGRIITNAVMTDMDAKALNSRIAEIRPSVEHPFPYDIAVAVIPKRKMVPPEVSKTDERRAQKADAQPAKTSSAKSTSSTKKKETPERKLSREELAKKKQMEDLIKFLKLPTTGILEHPAAEIFPGTVPKNIQRVVRAHTSDNEIRGWQCTGLYAPPGEIVTVHVATGGISTGYKIRIGGHTDNLIEGKRKAEWKRFPAITRTFSPDDSTITIANPFGGMIYVWAPKPPERRKVSTSSQRRVPQRVRFQFVGIVEAPQFILGKTKLAEWRDTLRFAPAPWAELQGEYFSALVPSSAIRDIENPTKIVEFWDKIIAGMDRFSGRKEKEEENERIVFDVDSTGIAGHSGNPIVLPLSLLKTFLDLDYLQKNGSWGLFFFLAQNRVKSEWTLYGNNDVPAAVIALNAMTAATTKMPSRFFDTRRVVSNALTDPENSGTPELIAAMIPPIEKFGWDPLERVFARYNNAKKPNTKTEIDKYETFFALWSRETKCNLGEYFENFGFPYQSMQQARLGKLKEFESDTFPPALGLKKKTPDGFIGDMPLGSIEIFFSDYNPPTIDSQLLSADAFQEAPEETDIGSDTEIVPIVAGSNFGTYDGTEGNDDNGGDADFGDGGGNGGDAESGDEEDDFGVGGIGFGRATYAPKRDSDDNAATTNQDAATNPDDDGGNAAATTNPDGGDSGADSETASPFGKPAKSGESVDESATETAPAQQTPKKKIRV